MPRTRCRALILTALLTVACDQQPPPAPPVQQTAVAAPPQLERIGGRPDLNGIWQALNSANWNLEAHPAEALDEFWKMGAIAAIPAGRSVVREGRIPYLPQALAQRDSNRASWPTQDPEAKCFMLGVPRVTYHPMPFQIFQDDGGDLLMVYPFAAATRVIHMNSEVEPPIDSWMGRSNGRWDGDVLEILTTGQNGESWFDRAGNFASNQLKVTERFTLRGPDHLMYEATLEDPQTFSAPWTIEMPLYRLVEDNAQLLEHKCVPFADKLLYQDLLGLE